MSLLSLGGAFGIIWFHSGICFENVTEDVDRHQAAILGAPQRLPSRVDLPQRHRAGARETSRSIAKPESRSDSSDSVRLLEDAVRHSSPWAAMAELSGALTEIHRDGMSHVISSHTQGQTKAITWITWITRHSALALVSSEC